MNSKLLPRLAGVLGINAVVAAVFWAFIKFGIASQDGLSQQVLEMTEGDPTRIQAYLDDMTGGLLVPGLIGLLAAALLACLWLILVDRNPPYGDKSARGKRASWAGFLLLVIALVGGLGWLRIIAAPLAAMMAPTIPATVTAITELLTVLAYWLSTSIFVPSSTKVAIPGASLFGS